MFGIVEPNQEITSKSTLTYYRIGNQLNFLKN